MVVSAQIVTFCSEVLVVISCNKVLLFCSREYVALHQLLKVGSYFCSHTIGPHICVCVCVYIEL